ncbi:unnamed protein product [Rotaria sordida]|uniref:Uncharacterized protein n=1 Tax=Rotaria sordida TaxID=392033 RepID=A0A815CHF0_9BILA|nr:unnamed protein product [Rotaria sordida]CAF1562256.1 unnamed protein product [Rotaria sordida]
MDDQSFTWFTPAQLKEKVQNQDFRENLLKYLEDVVKEDLDPFRDESDDGTSTASDNSASIREETLEVQDDETHIEIVTTGIPTSLF